MGTGRSRGDVHSPRPAFAGIGAAALAVLALVGPAARGNTSTAEEDTYSLLWKSEAPLALSGDGQWRVHVDASNTLHRVNVVTPARSASIALPTRVRALAASRSARKVALVTASGCLALADFGTGETPVARVTWEPPAAPPGSPPAASSALSGASTPAWVAQAPAGCLTGPEMEWAPTTLALSADGRLLATADDVVDLEAHRVIASRARTERERPLLARFVAGDRQLLTVDLLLGAEEGPSSVPSRIEIALWDLGSGKLLSLQDHRRSLDLTESQLVVPTGSGAVHGIDAPFASADAVGPPLTALTTWHADTCSESPEQPLGLSGATGMTVDPQGRWIAVTRPLQAEPPTAEMRGGFTDELRIVEIASGRQIARSVWKHALNSLVANADGSRLYALAAVSSPRWGEPPAAAARARGLGDVVEVAIPAAAPGAPRQRAAAWTGQPCGVVAEAAQAMTPAPSHRTLQTAWRIPIDAPEPYRYDCGPSCTRVIVRRDGSLWLDTGPVIAQLDGRTGLRLRTLPTPRSDAIASAALPAADGFFNAQGDTLSWRPFDASAPGTPAKRIVDVRPGRQIVLLQRQGDSILAAWVPKRANRPPDAGSASEPTAADYAFYDAHGRKQSEWQGTEDYGGDGWPKSDELQHDVVLANLDPCNDETGALGSGHDWRIGPFGSVMAWACGPGPGAPRVALWSDIDVRPRAPQLQAEASARRLVAHDGAIGVTEASGHCRVFDADRHAELGDFTLPKDLRPIAFNVAASLGLVLVEGTDDSGASLRAYSYR